MMNIFTFIWLIVLIYGFLSKDIRKSVYILFISMLFQCTNFISFDSFSCGPQIITSIFFIIKSFFYKYDKNIKMQKSNNIFLMWIFLIIYIIINSIICSAISINIFRIIQLLCYVITSFRLKKISSLFSKNDIENIIKNLSYIILFFGFITIFINIVGINKNNILKDILFNDVNSSRNIYYFKDSNRFYSTFMEPSYVSSLIVSFFSYFMISKSKNPFLIILLLVSIIMTFSSTAYVLLGCAMLYYFWLNKKNKKVLFYITLVLVLVLFCYKFGLFDDVLINKMSSSSGRVRSGWNQKALETFKNNLLCGIGYKNIRASSVIYSVAAELGIIGLFFYLRIYLNHIKEFLVIKDNFTISIYLMVIISFLSHIISCPDLDLCSTWLIFYIYAISSLNFSKGE